MALTSSTTPYVVAPGGKYYPIGMVWQRDIVVTSSTSMVGKTFFYFAQQFRPDVLVEFYPTAPCPACCRFVVDNYTVGASYVEMSYFGDPYIDKWRNVKVWYRAFSATEIRIRIEFVQTMDTGKAWLPQTVNLSTYDRLMKNHRLNPAVFENTYPAIYNKPFAYLRHHFQLGADCGEEGAETVETLAFDDQLGGIFWNEGTNFYDYALQLSIGGVPVTKLSHTTDTKVEVYFKLDGAFSGVWVTCVGIFRIDNISNAIPWADDLELNFGIANPPTFTNGTVPGTIPTAALKNSVGPVNLGGNLWKFTFEVDNSYITDGGEYKIYTILGPDSEVDDLEPWMFRSIPGGEEPPVITGDVDWLVKTYHPGDPVGTSNCVYGVAPGERIYIRHRMNKASWEAAAGLAFDANLYAVNVWAKRV